MVGGGRRKAEPPFTVAVDFFSRGDSSVTQTWYASFFLFFLFLSSPAGERI